jgi:Protein of unknown function (DUF2752)
VRRALSSPRARAALALLPTAIAAALLRIFPPWLYAIYPVCPIRALTGWRCPGCGSTRALGALLSGRFADALHYNPLAAILWPALAVLALAELYPALRSNRWRRLDAG